MFSILPQVIQAHIGDKTVDTGREAFLKAYTRLESFRFECYSIAPGAAVVAPAPPGGGYGANHPLHLFQSRTGLTLAFIGPVGLLAFSGLKRRSILAGGSLFVLLLVVATTITGCSSSATPQQATTPASPAATQVTVNAISGSITQSVMVTFTVQ